MLRYKTSFDQFAKVEVNGDRVEPLFKYLKEQISDDVIVGAKNKIAMKAIGKIPGVSKEKGAIKWNFTKFLVDKEGKVVARFSPTYKPEDIADKIKELI